MLKAVSRLPLYLLATVFLFFSGFPYFFMINTAFKDQFEFITSPWQLPKQLLTKNFELVLQGDFLKYFSNSFLVSAISVILVVILASLASYPLARMKFKLNQPIFLLFLLGMMIPVHSTLIPVYLLTQKIGLYDTIWGLIGPYIAFSLPVSVFIFTQFMQEVPRELEEAARIDGCGHFAIFCRVMFPLLKPAIATVTIYNFVNIWNEFIFALVLTSNQDSMTLPLGLREFYGQFSVNVPGMMAALTLASLPILIVYFAAQEKIVKGLAAGAVKG